MIRLPSIPGQPSTDFRPPTVSAAAAGGAQAQALGSLANSIAGASASFHHTAIRVQELENARTLSDLQTGLAQDYATLRMDLLKDPDPESRMKRTQTFFSDTKGRMDAPDLPPAVRDNALQMHDRMASRAILDQTEDSAKLAMRRAAASFENQLFTANETGDEELLENSLASAVSAGIMLPEERDKHRRSFDRKQSSRVAQMAMDADPAAFLEDLDRPDFLADFPGLSQDDLPRLESAARSAQRRQRLELSAQATEDLLAGNLTTPEEIREKYPQLSLAGQEELISALHRRESANHKQLANSQEYQEAVFGEVAAIMADWNPELDGIDMDMARMQTLLDELPASPLKTQYGQRIRDLRTGKKSQIKTRADLAMKTLDEHFDRQLDNLPEVRKMPLSKFVDDGFLKNIQKIQSLGFSEDQAEEIREAAEKGNSVGQMKFKELWGEREAGNVYAPEAVTQIADAIRLGHSTVPFNDPETIASREDAREDIEARHGRAAMRFAEWLEANPNPSQQEIESEINRIGGEEMRTKFRQMKLPQPPRRSGALDDKGAWNGTSDKAGKSLLEMVRNFEAGGTKEGFHRKAYWDHGQWSIGYGTKSRKGEVIDKETAAKRLGKELASHRTRVETAAKRAGLKLSAHELDALTSFDYNTGRIETLLQGGNRSKAEIADAMLLYRKASGKTLNGLVSRRSAERDLFLNGYS